VQETQKGRRLRKKEMPIPLGPTLRSTRWRGESRAGEVHGRRDREGDSTRAAERALKGSDPRERVVERQEGIGRAGFRSSCGTDAPGEQSSGAGSFLARFAARGKGRTAREQEGPERGTAPGSEESPEDGTPGALAGLQPARRGHAGCKPPRACETLRAERGGGGNLRDVVAERPRCEGEPAVPHAL
jgi:hypothetical protein